MPNQNEVDIPTIHVKTKVFLQKGHWSSQKAEKQRKNRTEVFILRKQVKTKFPAENAEIWWLH